MSVSLPFWYKLDSCALGVEVIVNRTAGWCASAIGLLRMSLTADKLELGGAMGHTRPDLFYLGLFLLTVGAVRLTTLSAYALCAG